MFAYLWQRDCSDYVETLVHAFAICANNNVYFLWAFCNTRRQSLCKCIANRFYSLNGKKHLKKVNSFMGKKAECWIRYFSRKSVTRNEKRLNACFQSRCIWKQTDGDPILSRSYLAKSSSLLYTFYKIVQFLNRLIVSIFSAIYRESLVYIAL